MPVLVDCVAPAAEKSSAPAFSNTQSSLTHTSAPHSVSSKAQAAIPLPSFEQPPGHEHLFADLVQRLVDGRFVPPDVAREVTQIDAGGGQLARIRAGLLLVRTWEATVAAQPAPAPGLFVLDPKIIDQHLEPTTVRAHLFAPLLGPSLPESQAYLADGFKNGFDLQIDEEKFPFHPVDFTRPRRAGDAPMDGAEATQKVSDEDVEAGRTWQPNPDFECIISPHFPHQKSENGEPVKDSYRAIHDLSATDGVHLSVNERIDPALCTLKYQDVRHHRANILSLVDAGFSKPSQAKSDMASAYKLMCIKPSQYKYLGATSCRGSRMSWQRLSCASSVARSRTASGPWRRSAWSHSASSVTRTTSRSAYPSQSFA